MKGEYKKEKKDKGKEGREKEECYGSFLIFSLGPY